MTQEYSQFNEFVRDVESRLDGYIEHGTDHELFLSGYLHGHFSLVVSQALLAGEYAISALEQRMQQSMQQAFEQGELEQADQTQASSLWCRVAQSR